ncbi:MAG: hypothetical protein AB8B55_17895 [Mariniblastus sp.]
MVRSSLILMCLAVLSTSIGCCSMGPVGPGCGATMGCSDCDGLGSNRAIAGSPLDGLRNFRKSLVCGSGCGEAYIGEWISSPPDTQDPCCNDQWVGGATKCRPFCWQPGTILNGLYGSRFCDGTASSTSCGCGGGCDGGCDIASDGYIDGGVISGGGVVGGGAGCSTCDASNLVNSARVAGRNVPAYDSRTRDRMSGQIQRIRR